MTSRKQPTPVPTTPTKSEVPVAKKEVSLQTSLFSFVQEIPHPEIKEHFLIIPYPSGLIVQVDYPENKPQVAHLTLEYKFKPTALREICDVTGDNEARTETFLRTLREEKKYFVPFVIDNIESKVVAPENLVIIRIVGKKRRQILEVK